MCTTDRTFKTNSYDYFRIASRWNASRTIAYDERDVNERNKKENQRDSDKKNSESEVVEMSKIDGQYLYNYSWCI